MQTSFGWVRLRSSQILVDLQARMRTAGGYLGANITEAWKRKYQVSSTHCAGLVKTHVEGLQVLPGRTHPMMNMSGTGGHLLHAFKMYVIPRLGASVLTPSQL